MTSTLTHQIRIDPTYKQINYFCKGCGTSRFAWNWGLSRWEEKYQKGEKANALELKKEFNALKEREFPWVYEVTKYASQQPFIYLQRAFQAFFDKKAKYPRYKKKGKHDSFYIGGDQIQIVGKKVKIPNLGWVRLRESLRFEGKINGVTISCIAGHWYISVSIETNYQPTRCENQTTVGVDLGIKFLATLSNGKAVENPRPLKKQQCRLRRMHRQMSRQQKGSRNRGKTKQRIAALHFKIACQRQDVLHKLTTMLTRDYRHIVIEDLDVSEMIKQKRLSRSIMDCGWYEFRRQLSYKAKLRRNQIFIADKWYASSKRCCACGHYKEQLLLSERIYKCSVCQIEIDRDVNAARCLEQLASTVSFTGIDACRQDGSVIMLKTSLQPAWKKQELSPV